MQMGVFELGVSFIVHNKNDKTCLLLPTGIERGEGERGWYKG